MSASKGPRLSHIQPISDENEVE